jgi:hypothetical protein
VTQPVALAERIVSLQSSLRRLTAACQARGNPAPSDPLRVEWTRALAEAQGVLRQHEAFETPFEPFKR